MKLYSKEDVANKIKAVFMEDENQLLHLASDFLTQDFILGLSSWKVLFFVDNYPDKIPNSFVAAYLCSGWINSSYNTIELINRLPDSEKNSVFWDRFTDNLIKRECFNIVLEDRFRWIVDNVGDRFYECCAENKFMCNGVFPDKFKTEETYIRWFDSYENNKKQLPSWVNILQWVRAIAECQYMPKLVVHCLTSPSIVMTDLDVGDSLWLLDKYREVLPKNLLLKMARDHSLNVLSDDEKTLEICIEAVKRKPEEIAFVPEKWHLVTASVLNALAGGRK